MKVTRAAVTILVMVVSAVEPQFTRFPALPSPPRIIFGGFRPIFRTRHRPRPRFRPPPVFRTLSRPFSQQQDQFNVIPSRRPLQSLRPPPEQVFQSPGRQVFQSARPATFRPQSQLSIPPPAPTMQPPPPPSPRFLQRPQQVSQVVIPQPQQRPPPPRVVIPQQRPSPPRVVISQQRPDTPTTPPRDARGFGALRPESLLNTFRPSSSNPSTVGQTFSTRQPAVSLGVSKELSNTQQSGFPRPLPLQSDNNIIGMFPPPPPPVTTTLAPVIVVQTTATLPPASLTTATTKSNTSPATTSNTSPTTTANNSPALVTANPPALISLTSSNSIVNELPLLNAGVLPLAGEGSNEHMLFPPFNHLGIPSDLLSDQELFPPFPSNQDLFPPFASNEN